MPFNSHHMSFKNGNSGKHMYRDCEAKINFVRIQASQRYMHLFKLIFERPPPARRQRYLRKLCRSPLACIVIFYLVLTYVCILILICVVIFNFILDFHLGIKMRPKIWSEVIYIFYEAWKQSYCMVVILCCHAPQTCQDLVVKIKTLNCQKCPP